MRTIYWILFAAFAAFMVGSTPGQADVDGNCQAIINGIDAKGLSGDDPSDAIKVESGQAVPYHFESPANVKSWTTTLSYGPFSGDVGSGSNDNDQTTADGDANVDDYAWMGVGLYRLTGTVVLGDGSTCTGDVLIRVEGNPLGTIMGASAAGLAVGGAAGLAYAGYSGVKSAADVLQALQGIKP